MNMVEHMGTESMDDSTAGITAGRVDSVRNRSILKTGLRLYDGETVGVAGCLGEPDISDLRKRAKEALGSVPFPWAPNRDLVRHREVPGGENGSVLTEAEAIMSVLSGEFPDILISGKLTFGRYRRTLTGAGLDLSFILRGYSLSLTFKRRDSSAILDGFYATGGTNIDRGQVLDEIRREFLAFLNPVAPPVSGVHNVVFTETGTALSQTIGDLHGLRYATGSSLLSGKRDRKVFSGDLTLLQYADEMEGTPFFDAEGTVTPPEGLPLVREGVFVQPFTDIRTAMTYDLPLTGAAGAQYDGVPSLSYPDLRVKPSDHTLLELLDGKPAILISVTSGGDFTPTGGFGAPVQLAYLMDASGKPVGRLPECSISSTVWKMLGDDFVGVSSDPFYPSSDQKAMVMRMAVEF
jgi:PmbA protein